jgi:hypothetical protein
MVPRREDPRGDERETVSYSLPRRVIKAVARYAVESDATSKSHAAEELIERGLETIDEADEARVTA